MVEDHLVLAERHVMQGEQHLYRQRALIAKLKQDGHNAAKAQQLLKQFEELQSMHIADRDRLRAELHLVTKDRDR